MSQNNMFDHWWRASPDQFCIS